MLRITSVYICILCTASTAWSNGWFWSHFSDGRAEVNGYEFVQPRYGQDRRGHAVMIFVTEPFSYSKAVKVDRYDPKNPDHFIALKLNHLRHFQTGVYDYSLMTSVFSDPANGMTTQKVTFGGQEWCGLTTETSRWKNGQTQLQVDSYFEGETTTVSLSGPSESEDAIWMIARGLMSGGPGHQVMHSQILGNATTRRLKHLKPTLHNGQFKWLGTEHIAVPAGRFHIRNAQWTRADQVLCTLSVEVDRPHRIIAWTCSDGESGRLTGSRRMAYWNHSKVGDEILLKDLGLPVPSPQVE